jgi:imidazolonepropionase-like amidohydrolase
MMSGGGITSERDPIESIQGTMAELEAIVTATGQFGTVAAVHAYHDTSVQNAITAGVMSIEHGNLMEDPDTFKMVAKAGAWIVPAMAAFAPDILDHPYYGNPALPAYAKTARVQKNGEKWVELANRFKVNLGFGSDVIIVTKEVWRPARDFQITQWGRAFGNYRTLKAMTSDNGRLMALTGVMNPYPHGKLGVIEEARGRQSARRPVGDRRSAVHVRFDAATDAVCRHDSPRHEGRQGLQKHALSVHGYGNSARRWGGVVI